MESGDTYLVPDFGEGVQSPSPRYLAGWGFLRRCLLPGVGGPHVAERFCGE